MLKKQYAQFLVCFDRFFKANREYYVNLERLIVVPYKRRIIKTRSYF